jgi:hypothetical protein
MKSEMTWKQREALGEVDGCKAMLTPQQYKTLRGQVLDGDVYGAMQGLRKILERRRKNTKE